MSKIRLNKITAIFIGAIIILSLLVFSELASKQPAYDDLKDTNPDAAASILLSAAALDTNKAEYLLFKKELSKQYEILLSEKYLKLRLSIELFKIDSNCESFKLIEESNTRYLQTAQTKNSISELEILSKNSNIKGFDIDKNGKLTIINKIAAVQAMEIPENFASMDSSDDGKTFFFEAKQGESLRVNLKSLGMSTLAGGDYIDAQGYSISRTGNKEVITLTNPTSDFKTNYNGQEIQIKPFVDSKIALIRDSEMSIETQSSAIIYKGMDADIQSGEFRIDSFGRTTVKGLAKVATYSGGDLIFLDENSRLNAELTSAESEFTAKSQDSNAEFSFSGEGNLHVLGNSLSSLSSEAEVKGTYYGKGSEQGDLAFDMKNMKLELGGYDIGDNEGFFAVAQSEESYIKFSQMLDEKLSGLVTSEKKEKAKNIAFNDENGAQTIAEGTLEISKNKMICEKESKGVVPTTWGYYFKINDEKGRDEEVIYMSREQIMKIQKSEQGDIIEVGGIGSGFRFKKISESEFKIYNLIPPDDLDLSKRSGTYYNGRRGYREIMERLRAIRR